MVNEIKQHRLTVDNLEAVRNERIIFTRLNFNIESGDCLFLVGPNGSGKSSLLKIIAGLLIAHQGTVTFDDVIFKGDLEHQGSKLHYVGHNDGLKNLLTVEENLKFTAYFHHQSDLDKKIMIALEKFNLTPLKDCFVKTLSAGQKRRVALARLTMMPYSLWLLDEPTSGLDQGSIETFENMVEAHRATGGIVVLSTHVPLNILKVKTLNLDHFQSNIPFWISNLDEDHPLLDPLPPVDRIPQPLNNEKIIENSDISATPKLAKAPKLRKTKNSKKSQSQSGSKGEHE
jgi:heme exporter protein A